VISPLALLAEVKDLSQGAMSPARRRTVISRAYYATYHFLHLSPVGKTFVRDSGIAINTHRQFITFLIRANDANTKIAGRKLEGLYAKRILADYFMETQITNNMTTEAVDDALEIIEDIFAAETWAEKLLSG
jgi:hypothetical protein